MQFFCFQDTILPQNIKCTLDLKTALEFSDRIIMAIPAQIEREVCGKIAATEHKDGHMLNLAKGIEISTGYLLHKVHEELCLNSFIQRFQVQATQRKYS